jgi:hypothetical protein
MSDEAKSTSAPIACTLTPANLAAQASRWLKLAARAMTERDETAAGVRLSFRAEPGVEQELRELATVESECCAWATWAVEPTADSVVLDVHSAGEGVAALHAMFTGLRPTAASGPAATASGR